VAAAIVALALAGCGVNPPRVVPVPEAAGVIDLRGTWTGTWGGTPLTLVLLEQEELGAYTGVYLGSLQVLGERTPSVSGVLTSTIRGEPVSVNARGWLGTLNGRLALVVAASSPPVGTQYLTLTRIEPSRLAGSGESEFPWGPRGLVELTRRPR
jgi:hypothetical protein